MLKYLFIYEELIIFYGVNRQWPVMYAAFQQLRTLHQRAVLHALVWFGIVLTVLSDYSVKYNESKE